MYLEFVSCLVIASCVLYLSLEDTIKLHNRKLFQTIEVLVWLAVIIATIFVATRNWSLAKELINYILYASAVIAVYYYLSNRSLLTESEKNSKELLHEHRELKNRQKTIDLIYNNSADGILILDQDKRIEEFSPGMEKITGYTKTEAIGHLAQHLLKFRSTEKSSILPDLMFTVASADKSNPYIKNSLVSKDGKDIDIEASYALLSNVKSGQAKSMAVIRDVSYEKALTERDKEFIAVTSHQLNTPLSIIRGYTSLLLGKKTGSLNTAQKQYLEEMHQACEKMVALINNLLSISRIEQGKIKLDIADVNLADVIAQVKSNLFEKIKISSAKINFGECEKNIIILGDSEKLIQAVTNIVDNALKYTKKGSVDISICDKGENAVIVVKDAGIGIPTDKIEKIGDRFFRTQEAINVDHKGTGLGVYIAKSIVEKHGGKLNIESQLSKGTEVTISLPKANETLKLTD